MQAVQAVSTSRGGGVRNVHNTHLQNPPPFLNMKVSCCCGSCLWSVKCHLVVALACGVYCRSATAAPQSTRKYMGSSGRVVGKKCSDLPLGKQSSPCPQEFFGGVHSKALQNTSEASTVQEEEPLESTYCPCTNCRGATEVLQEYCRSTTKCWKST